MYRIIKTYLANANIYARCVNYNMIQNTHMSDNMLNKKNIHDCIYQTWYTYLNVHCTQRLGSDAENGVYNFESLNKIFL